jgi:hypothetical protein
MMHSKLWLDKHGRKERSVCRFWFKIRNQSMYPLSCRFLQILTKISFLFVTLSQTFRPTYHKYWQLGVTALGSGVFLNWVAANIVKEEKLNATPENNIVPYQSQSRLGVRNASAREVCIAFSFNISFDAWLHSRIGPVSIYFPCYWFDFAVSI